MKKDKQGKTNQQNRDSTTFFLIGALGLFTIMLFISVEAGFVEFNDKVVVGEQNDPRPKNHLLNYLPPSFYDTVELDLPIDSSLLECGDSIYYVDTNTNIGRTYEEQLSIEPDYMYYDTVKVNKK